LPGLRPALKSISPGSAVDVSEAPPLTAVVVPDQQPLTGPRDFTAIHLVELYGSILDDYVVAAPKIDDAQALRQLLQ